MTGEHSRRVEQLFQQAADLPAEARAGFLDEHCPSGTPLRADAKVTFKEYLSPEAIKLLANKNSPDLTHIRTVKAGDHLPLMCYHIYGHSKHYVEVAAINNLTDFRALEPGTQIVFPPLAD